MTATLAPPTAADLPRAHARGRIGREYPALAVLLLGTAVAYLCNLGANGWANSFYSAAVQAGSVSWKAFFFGSSDAANSITVDKPPASLWVMELSARLFGLNSWSILVPQVLLGVGTVALLWATVRKPFGPTAGLLAGLALAVTPVAALMFRFNNPDALLVFLMVAAAWAMTNALRDGRLRWLLLTGAFIGFGFLTKQLQVLLVVPALALTYLIAGPPALGKRVLHLLAAGASMIVAAGWWLLAVELWPADSRPWIGGSHDNSILELTLGYNGLGRLNGEETGSVGPGGELPPGGNGMWGSTGITRLFEPAQGGQIAWLLPAALIGLLAGLLLRGKGARTDDRRAALILWGGWLLVTGLVFSYMAGIFHQYYTVALAPAIAALVGASAVQMWATRDRAWVRFALAATVGLTTATAWLLLTRSAEFLPWLRWTVLALGIVTTIALLVRITGKVALVVASAAVLVGIAGPVAYSADTIAGAHQGSIPSAGPNVGGMHGGPGGMGGPDGQNRFGQDGRRGQDGNGAAADGFTDGAPANGMPNGGASTAPGGAAANGSTPPTSDGTTTGGTTTTNGTTRSDGGGPGGFLGSSTPSARVTALLEADSDAYTWVAAAIGSNSAAGYQLATELPVMPIGGFNGSDPSPTLAQFQEYVAQGRIHYFIGGGRGGPGGGNSEISTWVQQNFTATEVDGVTLYDLTTK